MCRDYLPLCMYTIPRLRALYFAIRALPEYLHQSVDVILNRDCFELIFELLIIYYLNDTHASCFSVNWQNVFPYWNVTRYIVYSNDSVVSLAARTINILWFRYRMEKYNNAVNKRATNTFG